MQKSQKYRAQVGWGLVLVLTGISVLLRVPHVMPKLEEINQFTRSQNCIKFCFYFIGIFIICGGIKKILKNFKKLKSKLIE